MFTNNENAMLQEGLTVNQVVINNDLEPAYYAENGRGIFTDEQLLADAAREVRNAEKVVVTESYKKSASREALENAMYDYLSMIGKGNKVGEFDKKRNEVVECLNKLNYGREMNDMPKMSVKEVEEIRDQVYEQVLRDEEEVSTPSYIKSDVSLQYISSWDDDQGDFRDQEWQEEDDYIGSLDGLDKVHPEDDPVDHEWSTRTVVAVMRRMDPESKGIATNPLSFNGTYTKGNKTYTLKHSTVKQSLFYLARFARDRRFDYDSRSVLFQFVKNSWDYIKSQEKQLDSII